MVLLDSARTSLELREGHKVEPPPPLFLSHYKLIVEINLQCELLYCQGAHDKVLHYSAAVQKHKLGKSCCFHANKANP